MSVERSSVKSAIELLVAVPLFHLTVAGLYLTGYYRGFGSRISAYASSADIFYVTVSNIGAAYIWMLSSSVLFILWHRGTFGAWTLAESVRADPRYIDTADQKIKSDRRFTSFVIAAIGLGQTITNFRIYREIGYLPYSLVGFYVGLVAVVFAVWYAGKIGLDSLVMHATNIIMLILVNSFFLGLGTGQTERRMKYQDALQESPSCNNFAILRPVGTHFLAVEPKGSHVILNLDCQLKAKLAY